MYVHDEYVRPWEKINTDICLIKMPKDIYETGINNSKKDTDKTCVPDIISEKLAEYGYVYDCTPCGDGCVNAACLPTEAETGGKACWIAGWGKTEDGPVGMESKVLRIVQILLS